MSNFLRTVSIFYANPFINPHLATVRHIAWQGRKLANRFPHVITVRGIRVIIKNRTIANGPGGLLNAMGFYDPNNMFFVEEIFRKETCSVFFDIGANVGVYSVIAASQSARARALAFEPHPDTLALLRENIHANRLEGRVEGFQVALSNEEGVVSFSDDPGSSINRIAIGADPGTPTIRVPVTTADRFIEARGTPDFVKIDVEGNENQVLRGFEKTIGGVKVVLVECQDVDATTDILRGEHGFLGPYRLDYRNRTFNREFHSEEDWAFVHPAFRPVLEKEGFSFVDEKPCT